MRLAITYASKAIPELDLELTILSNNLCIFRCNLNDLYNDNGCKTFDAIAIKAQLVRLISKSNYEFELFGGPDIGKGASACLYFTSCALIFNMSVYPNARSISSQCIFSLTPDEINQFKVEVQRIIDLL